MLQSDGGALFVDFRILVVCFVQQGDVLADLITHINERNRESLRQQTIAQGVADPSAGKIHDSVGKVQGLQCARDIDAFPTQIHSDQPRSMERSRNELRYTEGAIQRGVEGDSNDLVWVCKKTIPTFVGRNGR